MQGRGVAGHTDVSAGGTGQGRRGALHPADKGLCLSKELTEGLEDSRVMTSSRHLHLPPTFRRHRTDTVPTSVTTPRQPQDPGAQTALVCKDTHHGFWQDSRNLFHVHIATFLHPHPKSFSVSLTAANDIKCGITSVELLKSTTSSPLARTSGSTNATPTSRRLLFAGKREQVHLQGLKCYVLHFVLKFLFPFHLPSQTCILP